MNEQIKEFVEENMSGVDLTPDNFQNFIEYQKEYGGVISIPSLVSDEFESEGYEIKYLSSNKIQADEQIMNDLINFNKVDYVICIEPEVEEEEIDDFWLT
jgi:hypothetical protein